MAQQQVAVPNDPSLCGLTVHTQAMLHDAGGSFALTNAQDLLIGS